MVQPGRCENPISRVFGSRLALAVLTGKSLSGITTGSAGNTGKYKRRSRIENRRTRYSASIYEPRSSIVDPRLALSVVSSCGIGLARKFERRVYLDPRKEPQSLCPGVAARKDIGH